MDLNKEEQEIYSKLEAKLKDVAKPDIDAIKKDIADSLKANKEANEAKINEAVNKALDEQIKKTNPFTKEQNIQVNQKTYPIGSLAIATIKAKQAGMTLNNFLAEKFKHGVTQQDNAMLQFMAKTYYNSDRQSYENLKSLGVDSITNGAGFSDTSADSEFIEQLRTRSVVRASGARVRSMVNGRLNLNRGAGNATAYMIGSGAAITQSQPSYDQIQLIAKKMGVLTPIDNEALRFDIHNMAAQVQTDITEAIALKEDQQFLQGTGSTGEIKGISNRVISASSFARATSPDADKAGKDLQKAKQKLLANNVRMVRPVWYMHPSNASALEAQVDGNGNPKMYAKTYMESGQMYGANVFTTTQVPLEEILLVDADEIVIGDAYDLILTLDESYLYANDQTTVRAVKSVDMALRHDEAAAKITSIDWSTQLL